MVTNGVLVRRVDGNFFMWVIMDGRIVADLDPTEEQKALVPKDGYYDTDLNYVGDDVAPGIPPDTDGERK